MVNQWTYGGMQQIGLGVHDIKKMHAFYTGVLGFDIPMFDEEGPSDGMKPYTGGRGWIRRATLLANLHGGAALEVWQHTERKPIGPDSEVGLGNMGIIATCVRCKNIHKSRGYLAAQGCEVTKIEQSPDGQNRCYCKDPEHNWVGLVETSRGWFMNMKHKSGIGGVCSVIIGVSDMDKSVEFYKNICGFASVVYDTTAIFPEFEAFQGQQKLRRVVLRRDEKNTGVFAHLLQSSTIELVSVMQKANKDLPHVFGNYTKRFWGDPGFIHLCFDVKHMDALKQHCAKTGAPFTVDTGSEQEFSMDDASGRFAYLEDPDRTLVEFVEVYELPIMKKLGLVLNVRKRRAGKPLSRLLIRLFSLKRTKT